MPRRVVVIAGGNAAFAAAVAARDLGAEVLVLERAAPEEAGGNTRFTAGAIRFAYDGVERPAARSASVPAQSGLNHAGTRVYASLLNMSRKARADWLQTHLRSEFPPH